MMTETENNLSAMSQPIDFYNFSSFPLIPFDYQTSLFSTGLNKSYSNLISNFYRRHDSSIIPFNYPMGLVFNGTYENYPSINLNQTKRSISKKVTKRPRLTAQIRNEILKLKSMKSTIFIWEIQQNLLENGICTTQTLPKANVIEKILNQSSKNKINVNIENFLNKTSPSPTLSSVSECSICLETYRCGQEVSILSCSHEYHSSCIAEWMLKSRSCPMCRKDIHNQPQFVTLLI